MEEELPAAAGIEIVVLPPAADALLALPAADALLALPAAAGIEIVVLLCAKTEPATNSETANAATIATIAIRFNLDI
jgi:hypothetical protein